MLVTVSHLKWQKVIKTDRVCKEKNLPWLFGVDRRQTVIPRDRVFYPHQTVMIDSYILTWDQSGVQSKKISNDQELIQSDPTSCPQNQKGNN